MDAGRRMPVVVSLEGGIGVGKSTVMSKLKSLIEHVPGVVFVDEPVNEWMQSGLLQAMYDGSLNTATFQHMVLMSLAADLCRVITLQNPVLVITERSPVSNYHVFAKQNLSGIDLDSYKFVWDRFMGIRPPGIESHYIYLEADAETLTNRIRWRKRSSEDQLSMEYVQAIATRHTDWMSEEESVHSVDASGSASCSFARVLAKLRELLSASAKAVELQDVVQLLGCEQVRVAKQ